MRIRLAKLVCFLLGHAWVKPNALPLLITAFVGDPTMVCMRCMATFDFAKDFYQETLFQKSLRTQAEKKQGEQNVNAGDSTS